MADHPISAFDLALEAAVASPNAGAKAQAVSEGCGDSSSNASNTAAPAGDGGLLAGPSTAAAVPPAVDLGAGAAPMDRDALARMWGAQFDSLELDGEWLDRLDMGFDLSDFAPQGQQDAAAAAAAAQAAAQQRSAGAGAGPSSEAADGLVPSMGDHHTHNQHNHNAYDMTAFDADVAAYAALDDFSGAGGLAVPSLGALVHPALPQPHHQPYGGFAAGGDDLKKPQQQQQAHHQQQQPQQQQQQLYGAPAPAPYGALPPQQQQPPAYYPQPQPQQQQQQQYAAAPTQYAPPQYHMQQQQQYAMPPPPPVVSAAPPAPAPAAHKAAPKPRLSLAASRPSAPAPVAAPSAPLTAADANALLTRAERVARFRIKRLRRSFKKTIRYESRRAYAEVRPRIKGRFATKEEVAAYRAAEAALREGRQDVVLPPFFAELAGAIGGGVAAAPAAQAAC